VRLVLV